MGAGNIKEGLNEHHSYSVPYFDPTFQGGVQIVSEDQKLFAAALENFDINIYDYVSGDTLHTFSASSHTAWIHVIAFHPDGSQLVTTSRDNTAKVWDIRTGEELLTLEHEAWVWGVDYSPDGSRIVTTGMDQTARIWDATSGDQVMTLPGHADWLVSASYSDDGRLIAIGEDQLATIWDASTGEELATLSGHTGLVPFVVFSHDGTLLVTNSMDGITKIWDTKTGEELLSLDTGFGPISFSPDDSLMSVADSVSQVVRVYVLDVDKLVEIAEERVTRALTTQECQQYLHLDACPIRE